MPTCFSSNPVWVTPTEEFQEFDQKGLVIAEAGSRTPVRIRMRRGEEGTANAGKCYFDVLGTGIESNEPETTPGWGNQEAPVATLDPHQRYLTEEALDLIVPNPNPQERIYGELRLTVPHTELL